MTSDDLNCSSFAGIGNISTIYVAYVCSLEVTIKSTNFIWSYSTNLFFQKIKINRKETIELNYFYDTHLIGLEFCLLYTPSLRERISPLTYPSQNATKLWGTITLWKYKVVPTMSIIWMEINVITSTYQYTYQHRERE